jgi:lipoprotein-anchoring transpeptidase ErfK/SrfK
MRGGRARDKKLTKQSRFASVLANAGERVVRVGLKAQSSVMRRICTSAFVAWPIAACAVVFLIASHGGAVSQAVDPGWQLVYAGQPGYGGDGLMDMFGDGTGQPVVARAFQLPPINYQQQAPQAAVEPQAYQPAPSDNQQTPALVPPAGQVAPAHDQPVRTQRSHAHQPAPVYYPPAPAQSVRTSQQALVYYQQAPAQQVAAPPSAGWRAAPVSQPDPKYTGSVPAQQTRGFLTAPSAYQTAPAPRTGTYQPAAQHPQPAPQYAQPAPHQRLAFGYQTQQQNGYQDQQQGYVYQQQQGYSYQPQQNYGYQPQQQPSLGYQPAYAPSTYGDMAQQAADPRYQRQVVEYHGGEQPGTVIIDTPHFFLYLVLDDGRALRYGIGVGRPGFTWAGVKSISAKREWPDWRPPDEMLARRPDLPRYMPGGPDNPLGARALYLGSTLYRIHGSNEPGSIGTQVSSGCIRLRNEDIIDLYGRVKVGSKVVVI